ncbi:hypothetical protein [Sulfurovum mangrovi]|uniref:hypothetical protein n=1 Tax=Sulfurovum mangrovi TaxID=2893889 RepID=UPI001E542973|nr:hypothetical protein [Sulfurovum mangrovi]UFH60334.1 hypothetical protein LN246_05645 [Sulfurovum mangrovi]
MARAPVHKLGQMIGDFIEKYFEQELSQICLERQLYLDVVGKYRTARRGKKVSWNDIYGSKHDLDFVIERGGTDQLLGTPAALIECAWRRYTKHSKNKAQEIQGAVLPIAEKYRFHKPFLGAILAGFYTEPSVQQLNSCGFETVYFKYADIVNGFDSVGVDVRYDEQTSDEDAEQKVLALQTLSPQQFQYVFDRIAQLSRAEIETFKRNLMHALDRQITQVIVAPLYGTNITFSTIDEAVDYLNHNDFGYLPENIEFVKIFIQIRYSNGDLVSGDFADQVKATQFLVNVVGA